MAANEDIILTLRFEMVGIERPFIYRVGQADHERVQEILRNGDSHTSFIAFDGLRGRSGLVNRSKIRLCHFLWDAPIGKIEEQRNQDDEPGVLIYCDGSAAPFEIPYLDEPVELMWAIDFSQGDPDDFIFFTDEDGEPVAINTAHMIVLDYATEIVAEGRAQLEAEEQEEARRRKENETKSARRPPPENGGAK